MAQINLSDSSGNVSGYLRGTNDALHSRTVASDVALPSTLFDNDTISIAAATVTAQVVAGMTNWDEMTFEIDLTAADTITVRQSMDGGTNYFVVDPINRSTGAQLGAAGVISADGAFLMPLNCSHVSFTKTGTAAAATIRWRTRVVGR